MIVIISSPVLFCQHWFRYDIYGKLYSLVSITVDSVCHSEEGKNNIAMEWPVQKLTLYFVVYPQANFLSNCTAPGDVFCLATGNLLPDVNLTLLEGIGVDRVGNVKI